ncbi:MAG: AAA family ATPase [Acidobacteriota bacterium]
MKTLEKIKLQNFKRFASFETALDPGMTILIGDNESGKSSILLAIDLTLSGSRGRIETLGLESLFNTVAVDAFLNGEKRFEQLPSLVVELYLNEQHDERLNGKCNSEDRECDGLSLVCEPDDAFSEEIRRILNDPAPNFPFEYYQIRFFTFSADQFSGYNRPVRHLSLDSTQIGNEYATREYVKDLYLAHVDGVERNTHRNAYRQHKKKFQENALGELNQRVDEYDFVLGTTGKATLESDLTIAQGGVTIQHRGKGQQCFMKTEFALNRSESTGDIDVLLLEEPENHLSHVNMKRLISKIGERTGKQLFIATHSTLVSARLDLRKCVLLNSNTDSPTSLRALTEGTAEFFMKAPETNVLEFVLSRKVILVEGDAEFILIESFFKRATGRPCEDSDTHVIAVGGTSFKRYLELAKLLDIKTAVIRDNDGNYQENCVEAYTDFSSDAIRIFAESDNACRTFEVSLYRQNRALCDALFGPSRRTLSVLDYMLGNKTEAAFALLQEKASEVEPPSYIAEAIGWISA